MVRKIQRTFDWEVCARWLAAGTVLYVLAAILFRPAGQRAVPLLLGMVGR